MYNEVNIDHICRERQHSLRQVMELMGQRRIGIVLIVDGNRKLLGTVTDGDIRRALLDSIDLDMEIEELLGHKRQDFARPIVGKPDEQPSEYIKILHAHKLVHLPIVDGENRVVGLVTINDLVAREACPIQAMVMAGGKGLRLRPLTEDVPKPMLPVGDRPLLEHIIGQLNEAGIHRVNIATHYKPDKITQHFGDGSDFGVELKYFNEEQPLGTVGALGLLEELQEPLLVINGDVLTDIDFRTMFAYHEEHEAEMTIAVRQYDMQVPYGVVECSGEQVQGLREKPEYSFFVNAGIYLLQPQVHQFIEDGEHLDMTELIQRLLDAGRRVVSFPLIEYWLDIGQPADYQRAQADAKKGKFLQ